MIPERVATTAHAQLYYTFYPTDVTSAQSKGLSDKEKSVTFRSDLIYWSCHGDPWPLNLPVWVQLMCARLFSAGTWMKFSVYREVELWVPGLRDVIMFPPPKDKKKSGGAPG